MRVLRIFLLAFFAWPILSFPDASWNRSTAHLMRMESIQELEGTA